MEPNTQPQGDQQNPTPAEGEQQAPQQPAEGGEQAAPATDAATA